MDGNNSNGRRRSNIRNRPAPPEGEGWVTSCVYDIPSNTSALCVFNALDIAAGPIGKAWVSHRVPVCFHGTWRNADQ